MAPVPPRRPPGLDELLDDDVVLYSPIVHTPQRGNEITIYLRATAATFPVTNQPTAATPPAAASATPSRIVAADTAVLQFETSVQGKYVDEVDIIRCNESGRIVEFRVMVRPAASRQHRPPTDEGNGRNPSKHT